MKLIIQHGLICIDKNKRKKIISFPKKILAINIPTNQGIMGKIRLKKAYGLILKNKR